MPNRVKHDDTFNEVEFLKEFNEQGSAIIRNILSSDLVSKLKNELIQALESEVKYQGTTDYDFYGYVLCNAKYGGSFLKLFDQKLVTDPINSVLGKGSIAYSYTSSSMAPGRGNDSSHIHNDSPVYIPDYILRMGVIIPLVEFTEENGATYYLPGSHRETEKPSQKDFDSGAKRLLLSAGDGWFFNTRLWHAGGINNTNKWRHALTLNMCHPWMKQRIDIPGILQGEDLSEVSDTTLQKLGFFSQPPSSYDEYFAPASERKFSQSNT